MKRAYVILLALLFNEIRLKKLLPEEAASFLYYSSAGIMEASLAARSA